MIRTDRATAPPREQAHIDQRGPQADRAAAGGRGRGGYGTQRIVGAGTGASAATVGSGGAVNTHT